MVAECRHAAVELGDLPHETQSQTGALLPGVRAAEGVELLENPVQRELGNSRASIAHADLDVAAGETRRHIHGRAARREIDRVLYQVGQRLAELNGVAPDGQSLRGAALECTTLHLRAGVP